MKVCGLTHRDDAAWALGCGADWLGHIVRGNSPAVIEPEAAAAIAASPWRVGVNVAVMVERHARTGTGARDAGQARLACSCTGWSPAHGPRTSRSRARSRSASRPRARAGKGRSRPCVTCCCSTRPRAGLDGGTGQVWPWRTASAIAVAPRRDAGRRASAGQRRRRRCRALRPFGVDASSGLESSPGRKDPETRAALYRGGATLRREPRGGAMSARAASARRHRPLRSLRWPVRAQTLRGGARGAEREATTAPRPTPRSAPSSRHAARLRRPAHAAGRGEALLEAGGCRVFLKREDLLHTGAHKINNTHRPVPAHAGAWASRA